MQMNMPMFDVTEKQAILVAKFQRLLFIFI